MATMTPQKPWLEREDWEPKPPQIGSLDPRKVEFLYDVDLDEFVLLYYGRNRRHTVHPVSETQSALIDPVSGEMVGVMYSQFMKTVVPSDPRIIGVLLVASVLAGDHISKPAIEALEPDSDHRPSLRERAGRALDALRGTGEHSVDEQKIRSLGLLPIPC